MLPPDSPRPGWIRALAILAFLAAEPAALPAGAETAPEPPFDPGVMAEWICTPAFERARRQAAGPCGCAWPGSCGDRAPAGCYCDSRCETEGDCCPDAGLCAAGDPS